MQCSIAQQYDSVVIETDSIDSNNQTYKLGTVVVFDYEILEDGTSYKLSKNENMFENREFELVPYSAETQKINKIHLIVRPVDPAKRSNENQTQISYLQEPYFETVNSTGAVDNDKNLWIHPPRNGFFNALETAPFPFIKRPLTIGASWQDEMLIGEGWEGEKWGKWEGKLLLQYEYKVVGREKMATAIGEIECMVIESTATTDRANTHLKSYFSETYGFIRLEYELMTGIQINFWMVDFKTDQKFNDIPTFFKTKEYLKN